MIPFVFLLIISFLLGVNIVCSGGELIPKRPEIPVDLMGGKSQNIIIAEVSPYHLQGFLPKGGEIKIVTSEAKVFGKYEKITPEIYEKIVKDYDKKDIDFHGIFIKAVQYSEEETMLTLLKKEEIQPAEQIDKFGNTPLHYASSSLMDFYEVRDFLLKKPGYLQIINIKNKNGLTPLHFAANAGESEVVKELLDKEGININETDKYGLTPLDFARNEWQKNKNLGGKRCCELIQKAGGLSGGDLQKSIQSGKVPILSIEPVPYYEIKGLNELEKEEQGDVFFRACKEGNLELANQLIIVDKNVINRTDSEGNTPLHIAVLNGHEEIVKALLDETSDSSLPITKNNQGKTPYDIAKELGYASIGKIMRQELYGSRQLSDDDRKNLWFDDFLEACNEGDVEKVENEIIEPVVSMQDTNGDTGLHIVTRNGNVDVVYLLLSKNAPIDIQNNKDETVIDIVINSNNRALAQRFYFSLCNRANSDAEINAIGRILGRYPEILNVKDDKGLGGLYRAIARSNFELVKFLLRRPGIDSNVTYKGQDLMESFLNEKVFEKDRAEFQRLLQNARSSRRMKPSGYAVIAGLSLVGIIYAMYRYRLSRMEK